MSAGGSDAHVKTVFEFDSGDGWKITIVFDFHRHIECRTFSLISRIPSFNCTLRWTNTKQMMFRIYVGSVETATWAVKWLQKLPAFKIESVDLWWRSYNEQVTRRQMIAHVAAELWNSQLVVASMWDVKFEVAVRMQENHFTVIIAQHLKSLNFRIETSFEFQRQVVHIIALYSRFIRSSHENVLIVWRHSNWCWHAWHVEILDKLDSLPQIYILVQCWSFFSVCEPLKNKFTVRNIFSLIKINLRQVVTCQHLSWIS